MPKSDYYRSVFEDLLGHRVKIHGFVYDIKEFTYKNVVMLCLKSPIAFWHQKEYKCDHLWVFIRKDAYEKLSLKKEMMIRVTGFINEYKNKMHKRNIGVSALSVNILNMNSEV